MKSRFETTKNVIKAVVDNDLFGMAAEMGFMLVIGFFPFMLFLMAVFLSGTSALGQPSSLILLFYRGFGTGVSAAMLYSEMGLKAFTSVVLLLLPKALCMLITAIIAVREALRSSCGLACCMTGADSYGNHSGSLRLYAVRFIVLAFISIAVSAADTVMLSLFSSIIS